MNKRISDDLLFSLRNHIPIDQLISKNLQIQSKKSEDQFRFLCPICSEFRASVHMKTNLGRCFACQKNFNSIDIVMISKKLTFLQSVEYLKRVLAEYQAFGRL